MRLHVYSLSLSLSLSLLLCKSTSTVWRALLGTLGTIAICAVCPAAAAPTVERITFNGLVPYHTGKAPMRDEQGRTYVVVDFMPGAEAPYAEQARDALASFDPKRNREHPQVLLLIEDYEKRFGIAPQYRVDERGNRQRSNVTTWVGASIAAYLTDGQIRALRADKNVRLVTDVQPVEFSSPPWYPSWNGAPWGELNDWGWNAVAGKSVLSGSTRKVYIIDSGVAYHSELGSVSLRLSVAPDMYPYDRWLVGCYTHATHVAGIIGATENNGTGRRGVYAGVNIVSITGGYDSWRYDALPSPRYCNNVPMGSMSSAEIGYALDRVVADNLQPANAVPKPHIVNLSMNPGAATGFAGNGVAESNWTKILTLVTPTVYFAPFYYQHPGHVLVQSAGNFFADSCSTSNGTYGASYAFKTSAAAQSTTADGVIVVGAVNSQGKPVGGANGTFANAYPQFSDRPGGPNPYTFAGALGSNYGGCVDMWAPGDFIYSTWGEGLNSTRENASYVGGEPQACASGGCVSSPQSGWAFLSGTSMAAPHVAAAAAYAADLYGLTTPAAIEQHLRNNLKPSYGNDAAGQPARMVQLQ